MLVKAENGEVKDVSILNVTPENYITPKGEENVYHCLIEIRQFDNSTGARISKPRIQKFGRKFFDARGGYHSLKSQGYTITILHNPVEWEKEQAAAQAAAQAKAQAAKKAESKNKKD